MVPKYSEDNNVKLYLSARTKHLEEKARWIQNGSRPEGSTAVDTNALLLASLEQRLREEHGYDNDSIAKLKDHHRLEYKESLAHRPIVQGPGRPPSSSAPEAPSGFGTLSNASVRKAVLQTPPSGRPLPLREHHDESAATPSGHDGSLSNARPSSAQAFRRQIQLEQARHTPTRSARPRRVLSVPARSGQRQSSLGKNSPKRVDNIPKSFEEAPSPAATSEPRSFRLADSRPQHPEIRHGSADDDEAPADSNRTSIQSSAFYGQQSPDFGYPNLSGITDVPQDQLSNDADLQDEDFQDKDDEGGDDEQTDVQEHEEDEEEIFDLPLQEIFASIMGPCNITCDFVTDHSWILPALLVILGLSIVHSLRPAIGIAAGCTNQSASLSSFVQAYKDLPMTPFTAARLATSAPDAVAGICASDDIIHGFVTNTALLGSSYRNAMLGRIDELGSGCPHPKHVHAFALSSDGSKTAHRKTTRLDVPLTQQSKLIEDLKTLGQKVRELQVLDDEMWKLKFAEVKVWRGFEKEFVEPLLLRQQQQQRDQHEDGEKIRDVLQINFILRYLLHTCRAAGLEQEGGFIRRWVYQLVLASPLLPSTASNVAKWEEANIKAFTAWQSLISETVRIWTKRQQLIRNAETASQECTFRKKSALNTLTGSGQFNLAGDANEKNPNDAALREYFTTTFPKACISPFSDDDRHHYEDKKWAIEIVNLEMYGRQYQDSLLRCGAFDQVELGHNKGLKGILGTAKMAEEMQIKEIRRRTGENKRWGDVLGIGRD